MKLVKLIGVLLGVLTFYVNANAEIYVSPYQFQVQQAINAALRGILTAGTTNPLLLDTTRYVLKVQVMDGVEVKLSTSVTLLVTFPAATTTYVQNTVTTKDERYSAKIDTFTSLAITGVTSYSTTISGFNLDYFSIFPDGGAGNLDTNFGAGMVLKSGLGRDTPQLHNPVSGGVFNLTSLSIAATYYMDIWGVK